jgi:hypothetical protein
LTAERAEGFRNISGSFATLAAIRREGESFYAICVQLSAKLFDKGASD